MKFELKHASFSYFHGGRSAGELLHDISLTAFSGEIVSILGANGAGKTTLLKCLMRFCRWDRGELLLDGEDAAKIPDSRFWKIAAYVPQAREEALTCTVGESVLMGRSAHLGLFGMPGELDYEIARRAMRMVGIEGLENRSISVLSGGQKQLALIARALAAEPRILFLDEPETGLDFRNQLIILNLLERLAGEEKLLILFNTHYPDHARRISDRTLLFLPGGAALSGPAGEILTEENLQRAFGVFVREARVEDGGAAFSAFIPVRISEQQGQKP